VNKRLIVPALTMIFSLMTASGTMASNTVLVSPLFSVDSKIGNYDYNMSQLNMGLTVPLNTKITVGLDLAKGEISYNGYDGDISSYRVKGAYKVYANPKTSVDLSGSFYHRNLEIPEYADYYVNSLTLGVDGRYRFNSQVWADLGLAFGLAPNEKLDEYAGYDYKGDPHSLLLLNLKFSYLLNKQLGVMAGYASESCDSQLLYQGHYYRGVFAGGFYRF
jgi:hypothetical protein